MTLNFVLFQINLRSVGRKRFAHLSENLDEIHVDANIPWGEDTLFTLEFHADQSGKYALHTCNNKYLSFGGKKPHTHTLHTYRRIDVRERNFNARLGRSTYSYKILCTNMQYRIYRHKAIHIFKD